MTAATTLLVALALAAPRPVPTGVPELPGEAGSWSAADRREFLDTCLDLRGGQEHCACLLEVFERHVSSLEEFRETYDRLREEAIEREGHRCDGLSPVPWSPPGRGG
jgi:hypothetical protein